MLSCGTPKVTGRASDNLLSQEVCWLRLLRYEETTPKTGGRLQLMTIWTSRSHNRLHRTPLKDPEIKHHKCSLFPCLIRLHRQSQTMQWLWNVKNENQNCIIESKLFESRYSYNWQWITLSKILLRVGRIEIGRWFVWFVRSPDFNKAVTLANFLIPWNFPVRM